MEISDCIWDDSFLCCPELEELESRLVGQLQTPFIWPEEPIIDEADNSDMTPQCMPVIDPNFVRESFIEDCLLDGISEVIAGGEDVLGGYLADQSSSEHLARLHVLVCGFCHAVFHVVEEFKSHLVRCDATSRNSTFSCYDSTSAVALVLWTNAVMRRVGENLSGSPHLIQRIEARWWRLSKKSRQVWEKAAEALRELAKVGNLVFPAFEQTSGARPTATSDCRCGDVASDEQTSNSLGDSVEDASSAGGGGAHFRWPGPPDFREADEIEIQGTLTNIKQESEASSVEMIPGDGEVVMLEPGTCTETHPPPAHKTTMRDKRGRWEAKYKQAPAEAMVFQCEACSFSTDNPWKMKRHFSTQKHVVCAGGGDSSIPSLLQLPKRLREEEEAGDQLIRVQRQRAAATRWSGGGERGERRGNSTRKSAISAQEKVMAWVSRLSRAKRSHSVISPPFSGNSPPPSVNSPPFSRNSPPPSVNSPPSSVNSPPPSVNSPPSSVNSPPPATTQFIPLSAY